MSQFKVVNYSEASYCKHCGKRILKSRNETSWWARDNVLIYLCMEGHGHDPMAETAANSVLLARLQLRNILKELE